MIPLLHKSLLLLIVGWWLMELIRGEGNFLHRLYKATVVALLAAVITAITFVFVWWAFIQPHRGLDSWFLSYISSDKSFWTGGIQATITGLGASIYRIFISLTSYKAYAFGSVWGYTGLVLSGVIVISLMACAVLLLLSRKDRTTNQRGSPAELSSILLALLPSLVLFVLWMPGYYMYWSRFLPALWVLLAMLPQTNRSCRWLPIAAVSLLCAVNVPSAYIARDGEETGRFTRWLGERVAPGDVLLVPGDGVLFDGKMVQYHYRVNAITLDYLARREDAQSFLREQVQSANANGNQVWLIEDRSKFSSTRLISGELSIAKNHAVVEEVLLTETRQSFHDPGMAEAWISLSILRHVQ